MARFTSSVGLVPTGLELGLDNGSVKDRPGVALVSRESMRLLGRSDVLRLKQYAVTAFAFVTGLFVCPPDARVSNSTHAAVDDVAGLSNGWILTTRTYITAVIIGVGLLLLCTLYVVAKQSIRKLLCTLFYVIKKAILGPCLGKKSSETISVLNWTSVVDDGPTSAENELPFSSSVSLPFTIPFASPATDALMKVYKVASSVLQKSADCIVDALAPFVFGSLLILTTATGVLLYGVGHVGIAKIADSGIFGLNEDAIDTLLEMIHMQWRLTRQLKWSWWCSVAERYESRFQNGFRRQNHEDGTEPAHIHDHHICTDATCPFGQQVSLKEEQKGAAPESGAPGSSKEAKVEAKTEAKDDQTKANSAIEAKAEMKATANEDQPRSARGHTHHHHHHHHHAGQGEAEIPKEHIKLDTRRDWLRWLIFGKDGNNSHYRDRHHRHNVSGQSKSPKAGKKAEKTTS